MRRHPHFGLVAAEHGWVPAPSYLLRRARVLEVLGRLPAGRVLEVGCGAGALLDDLSFMGWTCEALETSAPALEVARKLHRGNSRVSVREAPPEGWQESFDVVAAFEVLEHVEDDKGAMETWIRWLRPGGRVVLSVPAHRRRWGPSDVWAGHYRRYERDELLDLFRALGMEPERIECYGFPLANLIAPVRTLFHRRQLGNRHGESPAERSARSGIERRVEAKLFRLQAWPPGSWAIRLLIAVQDLFLERDWGTGYLVVARKPSPHQP